MRNPKSLLFVTLICVLIVAMLASCSKGANGGNGASKTKDVLSGSTKSIGEKVISGAKEGSADTEFPTYLDREITATDSKGMLGLTEDDFGKYVSESTAFTAEINVIAAELAIVKCKNAGDASKVKKLIADGFDPSKWICVMPERCFVVESGSYIMLFVGTDIQASKMQDSLKKVADGQIGEVDMFFKDAAKIEEPNTANPSSGTNVQDSDKKDADKKVADKKEDPKQGNSSAGTNTEPKTPAPAQ